MKKIISILTLIAITYLSFAQNETSYEVDAFNTIEVNQNFKVYLKQADEYTVTAYVPEGYANQILIGVHGKKLILDVQPKGKKKIGLWNGKNNKISVYGNDKAKIPSVEVYVTFPSIEGLDVSGAAEVKGNELITLKNFLIEASGVSNVDLNIAADYLEIDQSGSTNTNLIIEANKVLVETSGASKASLQLNGNTEYVEVDGSGASHVHLSGTSKNLVTDNSGASIISAKKLNVEYADIDAGGTSKIYIGTVLKLIIEASGATDVQYKISDQATMLEVDKSGAASVTTY